MVHENFGMGWRMSVDVKTEVAGQVWKIVAQIGDQLAADDVILILESMKMEIPITAPKPGKLAKLHVIEQDIVGEEQLIATLESE
jgi:acetyl-CoA carboxylase biotin carboxyl carrier protein